MAYNYFLAGSPLMTNPNETYKNDFQTKLDAYFDVASDVFTIKEETFFSSGSFANLKVRINDAVNNLTGLKLGDDFKTILFQDLDYAPKIGYKFYFDGSYWLVVNTDNIKTLAVTCMVRRCNNVLKWTDENGNTLSEHCIIDYKIGTPDNKGYTDPIVPEGTIKAFAQLNERTNTITENQRFLFGNSDNWMAYRIHGGGINNFLNTNTSDNFTSRLLDLALGKHFVNNDTDDLVNGIADRYKNLYTITVSPSAISGGIGDTYLLNSVVLLDGNPTNKASQLTTSNSTVASVSGSVVSLLAAGSAVITSRMTLNNSVSASVIAVVSSSAIENDVRFSPNIPYILQGNTQVFTCYYYNDGVQESGSFVFGIGNNNVPVENYSFTIIDGNSFSIENLKLYLDYPLVISATSGSISGQLSLTLRGAW